ncbi:MAG: amylo-alpha-1,6-glucosidase [Rhizobiaceae bacterium]
MQESNAISKISLPDDKASGPAIFFIPANASLQERRLLTLKHDDTFAVFDPNGDAIASPGSPEGIFHRDTRYLSHLYLTVEGARPMLLSSTLRDDNVTLTCDLTNPDLFGQDRSLLLEHDSIHIRRTRFLRGSSCFERLTIKNFDQPRRIRLDMDFGSDFADLFEVRGTKRKKRGETHDPMIEDGRVILSYTGLDKRTRTTTLSFDPAPQSLSGTRARFLLDLPRKQNCSLFLEIRCNEKPAGKPSRRRFFIALRDNLRSSRSASIRRTSVTTSNDIFNEALRRTLADLSMLVTMTPEGPYPYAGIPWFSTVFGRDAIITAMEVLWLDPEIARGVLGHLAANQATTVDAEADAEPGKILHEVRHGEMAELGEVPFRRYYGSIDSTPLFVMLAGAYLRRTDDLATIRQLWPHVEAALAWIGDYGDRDGDGFVEYGRMSSEGLVNQGWKDSQDSVFHADGALAKGPIALVEVQAYVYRAWKAAGEMARRLGKAGPAEDYERKAGLLRDHFDSAFFDEDLGTYVLALDGQKRPCRVRSSNAGHALFAGIAKEERAETVMRTLMSSASFCGWGVRTIASTEARYNPMSYHNGSVWPHDNAMIASGFARYGFRHEAARIAEGLFAASDYIDLRRLPELFCGFPRQRSRGPTFYPVACSPQAWAAAAPISLIQSCIGLGFDAELPGVIFDKPTLPDFLDEIMLKRLSIGSDSVDVCLRRSGQDVTMQVLKREGRLQVS